MRLGTAIVLLALGAILTFALRVDVSGVDLQVVGWILMIVGALGIVLELAVWGPRSRRRVTHTEGYAAPAAGRRSGAPPPTRPTDPLRPVAATAPVLRGRGLSLRSGPDRMTAASRRDAQPGSSPRPRSGRYSVKA